MPLSTAYANTVLDVMFSKVSSLTIPSAVYIGLCSNDPEADGGTITELSGNGYARVMISQKGEEYPNLISPASNREISNTYQINWTKATGNWSTAKGFFLADAPTGGNKFFYGKLETPVTVETGMVALFDPKSFKISFPVSDS